MKKINDIAKIIRYGGVVLMQTDTIFGLVCDGLNDDAIKKIENIKHRTKPSFGFFVRDIEVAKKYADMSVLQEECFNKVFPGYFTLILPASELAKQKLQLRTLGKSNNITTIGIRVPKNIFCLELLQYFNTPLVATSANISGEPSVNTFEQVDATILKSVDAIFYKKELQIAGKSSTIIDITNCNNAVILRDGSGDVNELASLISFRRNL